MENWRNWLRVHRAEIIVLVAVPVLVILICGAMGMIW